MYTVCTMYKVLSEHSEHNVHTVHSAQFWAVNYRWKIYCPPFDSLAASLVKVLESFRRKRGNYKETRSLLEASSRGILGNYKETRSLVETLQRNGGNYKETRSLEALVGVLHCIAIEYTSSKGAPLNISEQNTLISSFLILSQQSTTSIL